MFFPFPFGYFMVNLLLQIGAPLVGWNPVHRSLLLSTTAFTAPPPQRSLRQMEAKVNQYLLCSSLPHTLLTASSHSTYTPPMEFSLFVFCFLDEEESWKRSKRRKQNSSREKKEKRRNPSKFLTHVRIFQGWKFEKQCHGQCSVGASPVRFKLFKQWLRMLNKNLLILAEKKVIFGK